MARKGPTVLTRGASLPRQVLWLLPPLGLVVFTFLLPMGAILGHALSAEAWEFATGPFVRRILKVALQQAALSTALALAVALPLAWLHHSRRLPAPRLQLAIHAAPFVMPVFVIVYGLQTVLGKNGWLHDATGLDLLGWLGPLGAVVVAHAYYNYGFAARLLEANLRRRPRGLEAAARTLGASPAQAFWRASAPVLLPATAAVALLVFLFTFGSFGVVLFMGDGKVSTLETAMYAKVNTMVPDMPDAAALGVLQLGVNCLLLFGYLLARRRFARLRPEAEIPPTRAGATLSAVSWILAAAAAVPLAAVLVQGLRLNDAWSLEPWRNLVHNHPGGFDLGQALGLSLLYALASTVAAVALTACLAYGSRRIPALRRPAEALASIPVAGSGILLGVAFLASFGIGGVLDLEGTVWIVLLAHTILAFPFVARLMMPAFEAHDQRLDEAARLLGAPPSAVTARIHWPMLRPALLAAAGLALALSLGDFGASSLLMESDTRSLAVWIALVDGPFDPLRHASAVALAGLLCVLTLAAYVLVERLGMRTPAAKEGLA